MDQGGKFQTESKAIVHASYTVSLLVAKAKKPHSIGETLIKQCLVLCAGILLGESLVSKTKQVSLSNDNVKSRIFDMLCNIKLQLLAKVKESLVSAIQLDEYADVANLSQLIVFVRYVHDQCIEEICCFAAHWKQQPNPPTSCSLSTPFSRRKDWTEASSSMLAQMGFRYVGCEVWIRETTEAKESQGGDPALHHTSKSARIKDDDTTAQRSA